MEGRDPAEEEPSSNVPGEPQMLPSGLSPSKYIKGRWTSFI